VDGVRGSERRERFLGANFEAAKVASERGMEKQKLKMPSLGSANQSTGCLFPIKMIGMRYLQTVLLLCFGVSALNAQNLDSLRWKNRVLLIFSPDTSSRPYQEQLKIARLHRAAFAERDLVCIWVVAENMYKKYGVPSKDFAAVLIGKDGGEKFRSQIPVSAAQLFSIIDAMPMRRDEMRRSRQ